MSLQVVDEIDARFFHAVMVDIRSLFGNCCTELLPENPCEVLQILHDHDAVIPVGKVFWFLISEHIVRNGSGIF